MPYDSEGNFTRMHSWEEDRVNDIDIVSDRHDEEDDNFADGLNQALLRDGRVPLSGNLNMNNFQIKNIADGTASTDVVNKRQFDTALHKTGDETSSGTKQFNGNIVANDSKIVLQTETAYQSSTVSTPNIVFRTNGGNSITSQIGSRQTGQNAAEAFVSAYDPKTSTSKGEVIVLGYSEGTGVYAKTVTPTSTSNGKDIVTTEWARTQIPKLALPTWSSARQVGFSNNVYTATDNGYFLITVNYAGYSYFYATINGIVSIRYGGEFNSYHEYFTGVIPVKKGDVITVSGASYDLTKFYLVPCQ